MADNLTIVAEYVRYRLNKLTTLDISDDVLESPSMIPAADAWAEILLTKNSKTVAGLSDAEANLLKAAKIAFVALRVVTPGPKDTVSAGLLKIQSLDPSKMKDFTDILNNEIKDALKILGLRDVSIYVSGSGGWQYSPDSKDDTNIDYSHAREKGSSDPFRQFP